MTVDIKKLEALALLATPSKWATDGEKTVMSAESDQLNAGYAIYECHGPDALKNAKFAAAANPAAVLELIADNKRHRAMAEKFQNGMTDLLEAGLVIGRERDQLKAENEALSKNASIQDLLCCNICTCMIQPANQLQVENERLKAEIELLRKAVGR